MISRKFLSLTLIAAFTTAVLFTGCESNASSTNPSGVRGSISPGNKEPQEWKQPQTLELKLGHPLDVGSERHVIASKLADLAFQKSNKTLHITVYPQAKLGDEVKAIQAVSSGIQGITFASTAAVGSTVKEYYLFDLPYLFENAEQADKVLRGEVGKKFLDMLPKYGMIGLGWAWPNERNLFSNKPIRKPEDLKNFKTRVLSAPGYVKAYESLGASPTPFTYSGIYTAAQQGVLDGADVPPDQYVMDKFVEVSKYYNKTKIHYVPMVVVVSKLQWDAMTRDQQQALQESADEALEYGREFNKTYYNAFYEQMKQAGIEIIEPDIASFKEASKQTYDSILKDVPNGRELLKLIETAKNK